jgi:hypothetical protein
MIRVGAVGLVGPAGLVVAVLAAPASPLWWIPAGPLLVVALVGVTDLVRRRHSVPRNVLSSNAILALNVGAARGGSAHDLSEHHPRPGGDLIREVGPGHSGCHTGGGFDADEAAHDNVRCGSLEPSQGAEPGIGGVLPGRKVNGEIAKVRDVPVGRTVISPQPTGFTLCVGSRGRFLAVCDALVGAGGLRDTELLADPPEDRAPDRSAADPDRFAS